jgi:predicted enzyme related to lactoylglutathione lyase
MGINAVHALIYSQQADAVRAFLRDVLGWSHVDDGQGWLIFAMPPAEVGVHPTDGPTTHELYLMCDDIEATVAELAAKGVECADPVSDRGWGLVTAIKLPDGSPLGLYEPRHPSPLGKA